MNILRFPRRSHFGRAFTLVELLVVISIIAILAGLLLPVVNKVINNASKVQTKAAEMQIVGSIKSFQTDYGVYPVPTGSDTAGGANDLAFAPTVSNAPLFTVLRAQEAAGTTVVNTRSVVYFEGTDAKNLSSPKGGFVPGTDTTAKGNSNAGAPALTPNDFVDAWGNRYGILMDTNYNNVVKNPYTGAFTGDDPTNNDSTQDLRFGVVVWSPGYDGIFNAATNPNDDVISWQ